MKTFFLGLRIALGLLFLYAGWSKTMASDQFLLALVPFTFVPGELLPWIAFILPTVEIAGGLLLLAGFRRIGGGIIFLLCLLFIGVLCWALLNDIIVACSCFGHDETPSAGKMWLSVARDVGLALAALAVICEQRLSRLLRPGRQVS